MTEEQFEALTRYVRAVAEEAAEDALNRDTEGYAWGKRDKAEKELKALLVGAVQELNE